MTSATPRPTCQTRAAWSAENRRWSSVAEPTAASARRPRRPPPEAALVARAGGAGDGSARRRARGPPEDWRQSSAPPAATSTSGHTIASENQRPRRAEREQHAEGSSADAERDLDRPRPACRRDAPRRRVAGGHERPQAT